MLYRNKERHKAWRIKYRLKNKEKIKETRRLYNLKNKNKIKKSIKLYRLKNKDKIKKYNSEYRTNNKDKIKEYCLKNKNIIKEKRKLYNLKNKNYFKKYRLNNRYLINSIIAKRRAAKLKATPKFANLNKIKEIYKNCPKGYHVDHIIPLQGNNVCGLHVEWNLQYLTPSANLSKSNKLII